MFVNTGTAITDVRHAAALLQMMPTRIMAAAKVLAIEPVTTINGRPHFADADIQRIREHLAAKRGGEVNIPATITPDILANVVAVMLDDEAVLVVHRGGVVRHECQTSDDAYRLKNEIMQTIMAGSN